MPASHASQPGGGPRCPPTSTRALPFSDDGGLIPITAARRINEVLEAYCKQEQITFTRGRPYQKRDQCFVEQKNGVIVRQVVGYDRLVGEHASAATDRALPGAATVTSTVAEPSMKLLSKEHDGKKIRYVYDPAKTPLQRLLLSGILPAEMQQELTEVAQVLDPIGLLHQLKQLQQAVFRRAAGCSPFVSSPLADPLYVFSVEKCTAGKLPAERSSPATNAGLGALCREQERRKRVLGWRRTHKDPFEGEWEPHYFTRNRTRGSDFSPFLSSHGRS